MPVELEVGNRLTIPRIIRRLLEIKENDFLFYYIEDKKIILSKIESKGYPINALDYSVAQYVQHCTEF